MSGKGGAFKQPHLTGIVLANHRYEQLEPAGWGYLLARALPGLRAQQDRTLTRFSSEPPPAVSSNELPNAIESRLES